MRAADRVSSFHPMPVLCLSYGASYRHDSEKHPYQDNRTKNPARATDARFFQSVVVKNPHTHVHTLSFHPISYVYA